jgi:hypothetical protein
VLVLTSPVLTAQLTGWIALAMQPHLPAIYQRGHYVAAGGLLSDGVSQHALERRAAA